MKLSIPITAICCTLAFFAACSKSDSTPSKKDMLVAGKWQISAVTATTNYMGKDTMIDVYSTMDACEKDNFELYMADGTGTVDEGANVCAGQHQVTNFTWALLNNDSKLALVDSNPDTAIIAELTSAEMKLQLTGTNTSGAAIYYNYTLKNIK